MNVDGYVSSGGLGGPAILPQSLAKMAQLTQAFPDQAFSGIGGVAEFAHALNYFLLGCGTVQVCTAAMLDHAIGPNVIKQLIDGHARASMERARLDVARRLPRPPPRPRRRALEDSPARRRRRITAATTPKGMPPPRQRRGRAPSDSIAGRGRQAVDRDVRRAHRRRLGQPALESRPRADAARRSRTWSTYHIAALWIGMSVVITTYTLASGLMQQGMTWWQAMLTILLGNTDRAGADDPQRARRHEVRRVVPGAVPRQLRRARRQRAGDPARARRVRLVRHPDVDRRRWRWTRCCAAAWPAWAACRRRSGSRSRCSGWCRSRSSSAASKASRSSESWSAPLLLGGGALLLLWAIARGGGLGRILARVGAAADGARAVLAAVPGGAHRQRRLLGDAQPQHSRLHALRAQPAIAGARPGARPAGDDDGVRVHRRGGHQRDDRDLRRGDLGSGRAHRAHRQPAGHHLRRAGRPRRAAHDQHGGQRRVAGQRLLEPGAAPHQLRHRRPDHRRHRHRR